MQFIAFINCVTNYIKMRTHYHLFLDPTAAQTKDELTELKAPVSTYAIGRTESVRCLSS